MFSTVKETGDLRKILSQNIRDARLSLHFSQARLAESSGISLSYMVDIEYCKTWVSDKTLSNIAGALNMEAYQLLIPPDGAKKKERDGNSRFLRQAADLINEKRIQLRKNTDETMKNLLAQIVKMYPD